MRRPFVYTEDGYWYMTCRVHDTDDEPHIGIASHAAAMNIATLHYELHHQLRERRIK